MALDNAFGTNLPNGIGFKDTCQNLNLTRVKESKHFSFGNVERNKTID